MTKRSQAGPGPRLDPVPGRRRQARAPAHVNNRHDQDAESLLRSHNQRSANGDAVLVGREVPRVMLVRVGHGLEDYAGDSNGLLPRSGAMRRQPAQRVLTCLASTAMTSQ